MGGNILYNKYNIGVGFMKYNVLTGVYNSLKGKNRIGGKGI